MKKKLPKHTVKQAWSDTLSYYPFEFFKRMFPGKKYITARDVLKVSAKKFKHRADLAHGGFIKSIIAYKLMPVSLRVVWDQFEGIHGSSADTKFGLKLCDQYERGEI